MATATKKKTSKKKASKKKASKKKPVAKKKASKPDDDDPLAELEREIEDDLESEFDFDEGDASDDDGGDGSLLGKTVTFVNDDDETIVGKVMEQDGKEIVVEDDENLWEANVGDVEIVEEEEEEETPKKASKKKTSSKKTKATKPVSKDEDSADEDSGPEIRLIEIDKIKIPKIKARDHDPDDEDWKRIVADIKRRGLRLPIEVDAFTKPTLTDGLGRVEAFKALGRDTIPCIIGDAGETQDDRLWNSVLANEMRREMHWIDLSKSFARLSKNGEYSQRKISRAFGMGESDVSRMINALQLPKGLLEIARKGVAKGKNTVTYSPSVFYELVKADDATRKEILKLMKAGEPVTVNDVRGKKTKGKKKAEQEAKDKGEAPPKEKRGGKRDPKKTASTYRALSSSETGDYLKVVVHNDHVEVRAHIEWTKKTFRNMELIEEIGELFEIIFADEEIEGIDSMEALAKAMTAVKAELG